MLRHRIPKTWNCEGNKTLVVSKYPVKGSPCKNWILIIFLVVGIVLGDVETNILRFDLVNCQLLLVLSFLVIIVGFFCNVNGRGCFFGICGKWNPLLVRIGCSPLKQDVLVEPEVTSKHDQGHICVKQHPIDLFTLLKS